MKSRDRVHVLSVENNGQKRADILYSIQDERPVHGCTLRDFFRLSVKYVICVISEMSLSSMKIVGPCAKHLKSLVLHFLIDEMTVRGWV